MVVFFGRCNLIRQKFLKIVGGYQSENYRHITAEQTDLALKSVAFCHFFIFLPNGTMLEAIQTDHKI